MAFLFIWQFLISGPLELGSGLIAIGVFLHALSPELNHWNDERTWRMVLAKEGSNELAVEFGPLRVTCLLLGGLIVVLLYRRITSLGRLTVTFWVGVLGAIAWILIVGAWRFDPAVAFDWPTPADDIPPLTAVAVGAATLLAIYSYLGYYNVCYIGDEVRDPGRTIPRAILLSALLVVVLFVGLHLAMLGTVSWREIPTTEKALGEYSLPAEFMRKIHGEWAVWLITFLLVWSCFGSAFAGLLGYSRIPYGAARAGHFFAGLGRVHPSHRIPHVSLLVVGGLTLFWTFFDLQSVITAMIVTRIIEQFLGQALGVVLLRRLQPERPRPYRMWLYPLPCLLAGAGWALLYLSAQPIYKILGLVTLFLGVGVFIFWSWVKGTWPFDAPKEQASHL
jgi:amino acid transporter